MCFSGTYPTPTSAVSLEFVSDSASDALNSTGAHEITVEGLDANWNLQSVSTAAHATDGTTAVAISGTWLRVFRAYVSSSGAYADLSSGSHAGNITIRVSGAGATYASIPVHDSYAFGQSLIGAYSIPTGYTGHVFLRRVSADTGKTIDVAFFKRELADDTTSAYSGVMRVQSYLSGINGGSPFSYGDNEMPLGAYTGPCDIGFMAHTATGTAEVSVEFEIFLVAE